VNYALCFLAMRAEFSANLDSREAITKTWNKVVVDRTNQLTSWVDFCDQTTKRGVTVYAYANNHYAGFGPATVDLFRSLWHARGLPEIGRPQRKQQESLLFDL
jgi:hypothetical protein